MVIMTVMMDLAVMFEKEIAEREKKIIIIKRYV